MKIDFGAFLNSLPIMGWGMLGIFVAVTIILIMMALNKFTSK